MPPVFDRVTVLDFTQDHAGNLATMLLADNGARVIKIEPPEGDRCRTMPAWRMWNRGKESVVLDLSTTEGRGTAQALAQRADVLVESFLPGEAAGGRMLGEPANDHQAHESRRGAGVQGWGEAARHGLDYGTISQTHPALVHCSITAFGPVGPHAHLPPYDAIVQAVSGELISWSGGWGGKGRDTVPQYRARPLAAYGAAHLAVQGIAAALRVRRLTGRGQHVATSLYQGLACYDAMSAFARQRELGIIEDPPPPLGKFLHVPLVYLVARCKDGQWMQMTCNTQGLFQVWMRAIGMEGIFQDPRFKGAPYRLESAEERDALRSMILERMLERTLEDWIAVFIEHNVAGDRFLTVQQAMDHPQMRHNGAVTAITDPTVGATEQLGPIAAFSATPSAIGRPAPRLGQHTAKAMAMAARPLRAQVRATRKAAPAHPFAGMLILDFAPFLAAPFGTSLAADMGARVIKIEPPDRPDDFRSRNNGRSRTFQGKESMALDLKTEEGRAIIRSLVAKADGLLHNMRGDAPSRTGIDYATVREINPRIVYLYAGSYGSTGPGAGRGAFHPTAGALTGGALLQLGRGNQPPASDSPLTTEQIARYGDALLRANEGSPDISAALAVGTAMAMGLYARERTGKGQYIETSMLTSNAYVVSEDFLRYPGKPEAPTPDGDLRGVHALQRLYRATDGWLLLSCPTEGEWLRLCTALGRDDLPADPRFGDPASRLRHDDQLIALLGEAFRERSAAAWERMLAEGGVACVRADGPSAADFFLTDPGVRENGFIAEVQHPGMSRMMRQGPGVQFSLTPACAGPPHLFGQDTPAILREIGVAEEEIARLRREGIIAWSESPTP